MIPAIWRPPSWLPIMLFQYRFILKFKDLDFQWPTAFEHFLFAIVTESPQRQVTTRAST